MRAQLIASDTAHKDLQCHNVDLQQRLLRKEEEACSLKAELLSTHSGRKRRQLPSPPSMMAEAPSAPHPASLSPVSKATQGVPCSLAQLSADRLLPWSSVECAISAEPLFHPPDVKAEGEANGMSVCCPGSRAALQRHRGSAAMQGALKSSEGSVPLSAAACEARSRSLDSLSASSRSSLPSTVDTCANGSSTSMLDLLCTAAHFGGIEPAIELPPADRSTTGLASLLPSDRERLHCDGCESGRKRGQAQAELVTPSVERQAKSTLSSSQVVGKSNLSINSLGGLGAAGSLARIRQAASGGIP